MTKRIALMALVFLLGFSGGAGAGSDLKVTICYTNSLNGYLDYCRCKEEPKGGLVKRATVINRLRKSESSLLLFETGDFFHFEKDELLARYILKAYRHINYDGILFGDQEFTIGVNNFLAMKDKLPFLCNNLYVRGKGQQWPRYRVIRRKGIRFGVIGTMGKNVFRYYNKSLTKNIRLTDPVVETKRDIERLRARGIKYIILLSHCGYDTDRRIARSLRDIDIIIGGHSQTLLKKPVRVNGTLIVQAGSNGAHIGILRAVLRQGKIVSFRNTFKRPDHRYPADNPAVRKIIQRYSAELKKKYRGLRFNK